ncbi:hypothetical protein VTK73DRAFT_3171 [Phialemonium thermophilum]|uniref:NADP-dependent oxidoreductase domain-containing protein n=1 Tax=Phialemonium thermophilum TaxID=223376 RepID=A0ABR3VL78_9PEZI
MVRESWYGGDGWRQMVDQVVRLKPIADRLGATQSQLALAWCLKNEHVSSVITGASRPEQIVENVQALQLLDRLTPEILAEIDAIVGKIEPDPARQD